MVNYVTVTTTFHSGHFPTLFCVNFVTYDNLNYRTNTYLTHDYIFNSYDISADFFLFGRMTKILFMSLLQMMVLVASSPWELMLIRTTKIIFYEVRFVLISSNVVSYLLFIKLLVTGHAKIITVNC